jgi:hypothetical protein
MNKIRTEPTIVEKAVETIPGFDKVFKTLFQQTTMRGQSKSTFHNYIRRIASIYRHFGKLPELISDDELHHYR